MGVPADIRIEVSAIGGGAVPVRLYFIPHCHRCGWTYEPAPTRDEALVTAEHHLRFACLTTSTLEAESDPLPGNP